MFTRLTRKRGFYLDYVGNHKTRFSNKRLNYHGTDRCWNRWGDFQMQLLLRFPYRYPMERGCSRRFDRFAGRLWTPRYLLRWDRYQRHNP